MGSGGTADSPVPHAAQEARLGGLLRKARLARRRRGVGGVALLVHEAAVFGCGGLERGGVSVDGHGYGSCEMMGMGVGSECCDGGGKAERQRGFGEKERSWWVRRGS